MAFRKDRTLAGGVVYPDRAPARTDRRDERLAIGGQRNALFLGGSEGNLLRRSVRELLPPDVRTAANNRAEVHPLSVGSPSGSETGALRSDQPSGGASIERDELASVRECMRTGHLDHEHG